MNDVALFAAGLIGIVVSLVHGRIGATRLLPPIQGVSQAQKRVLEAVFQLSTLYWFAGGLILIMVPVLPEYLPRGFAAYCVAFLYASGAVGNFWATKGRHIGWALLTIAAVLAIFGA